jgi:AdoMet-dependent rRNA methyltransferase SPB1
MDLDAHPATTPEIRSLCADLGVLGRVDFKNLLKWRLAVRKSKGLDGKRKAALRGGVAAADDDDETPDEPRGDASADASDSDEKILEEMAELQQGVDARARRDKKKKAKLRAKERMRTALGLVGQDEEGATGASEMDLFSLARIKSKGGLNAVQAAAAPGIDASRDSDDDLGDVERRAGARGKYDDSSEEEADAEDGRANDARLEAELDLMWREYKARHGKKGV